MCDESWLPTPLPHRRVLRKSQRQRRNSDACAKESLWLFSQRGLDVQLGCSQAMHIGKSEERQPESLR